MKIIKYLSIISAGFLIVSCNKIDTSVPEFSVDVNKTTFAVGDTAKFILNGASANVVFYSGEPGNDYNSRNTFTATGGVPEMTFNTALTTLTGASTATNLSVLVSNNFNGKYTQTDILAATWTDISSKVIIPGVIQRVVLTPYIVQDKPLYIAFRFQTINPALAQRLVTISNFSFTTVFPNQIYKNATSVYDAGFGSFDFAGAVGKWLIPVPSTTIAFTHPSVPAGSEADNDWAISKAMETNVVSPSVGFSVKALSNDVVKNFKYKYTKPGTYKVTFVASNNTNNEYKEVVKDLTITVN